jgi:3-mercaptopyruvate sulfurtransferase SseA
MKSRSGKSNIPALLIIGGALILIVAILIVPRSIMAREVPPGESPSDTHVEESLPEVPRVGLAESKQALDEGVAIFLDVRDEDSYAMSRIPGSVNIPTDQLPSRQTELDPNEWIITYCT